MKTEDEDSSTSLVFTMKEEVGALKKAPASIRGKKEACVCVCVGGGGVKTSMHVHKYVCKIVVCRPIKSIFFSFKTLFCIKQCILFLLFSK